MPRLLLIQIRRPGEFSFAHERTCMSRRIPSAEWVCRSVFESTPNQTWLDDVDGFVIGGSGGVSLHDPCTQPWLLGLRGLLEESLTRAVPGFCICFGHQVLAHHLGAAVVTDHARREAGSVCIQTHGNDPAFARFAPEFYAHAGHSDHVTALPAGASLLASNETSPIQAYRLDGTLTYAVQFHPDLKAAEAKERYIAAFGDGPESKAAGDRFDPQYDSSASMLNEWAARIPSVNE